MRAYVATSGVIFALIVLAHILRVATEGATTARDPWFLLTTAVSVGLTLWAFRLFRAGSSVSR